MAETCISHLAFAADVLLALSCPQDGRMPRVATKFLGEKMVVRATRRTYRGKIQTRPYSPVEILLHIGRPNYEERQFIAACKKAGEPFPVKKIQFRFEKGAARKKAA